MRLFGGRARVRRAPMATVAASARASAAAVHQIRKLEPGGEPFARGDSDARRFRQPRIASQIVRRQRCFQEE